MNNTLSMADCNVSEQQGWESHTNSSKSDVVEYANSDMQFADEDNEQFNCVAEQRSSNPNSTAEDSIDCKILTKDVLSDESSTSEVESVIGANLLDFNQASSTSINNDENEENHDDLYENENLAAASDTEGEEDNVTSTQNASEGYSNNMEIYNNYGNLVDQHLVAQAAAIVIDDGAVNNEAEITSAEEDRWNNDNLFVCENVEADQFKLEPEADQQTSFAVALVQHQDVHGASAIFSAASNRVNQTTNTIENIEQVAVTQNIDLEGAEAFVESDYNSERINDFNLVALSNLKKKQNTAQQRKSGRERVVAAKGPILNKKAPANVPLGQSDGRGFSIREPSPGKGSLSRLPLPVNGQKKQLAAVSTRDDVLPLLLDERLSDRSGAKEKVAISASSNRDKAQNVREGRTEQRKGTVQREHVGKDNFVASSNSPLGAVAHIADSLNCEGSVSDLSSGDLKLANQSVQASSPSAAMKRSTIVDDLTLQNKTPSNKAVNEMQGLCGKLKQLSEMSTQAFGGGDIPSTPATPMKDVLAINRASHEHQTDLSYKPEKQSSSEEDLASLVRQLTDYHDYQPVSDVASLAAENLELKEALEKECWKRKHCERQIQQLQNKLLELQEQLAVAMAMDSKKRKMTEHLDRTLSNVVENWKKQESEYKLSIQAMREEKAALSAQQHQMQANLAHLERELEAAVETLGAERQRFAKVENARLVKAEEDEQERKTLRLELQQERHKMAALEKDKEAMFGALEQTRQELHEQRTTFAKAKEEWELQEQDYIEKMSELTETHVKLVEQDKIRYERQTQSLHDSQKQCSTLQRHSQQLEIDLDLATREKESLKVELGIMEAKLESSLHHLEIDLTSKAQSELAQKMEEMRRQHDHDEKLLREQNRQQLQQMYEQHRHDTEMASRQHRDEMLVKEERMRAEVQEFKNRLEDQTNEIMSLRTANARLESQQAEMTNRLRSVMQSHCNEVLRLVQMGAQAASLPISYEASLIHSLNNSRVYESMENVPTSASSDWLQTVTQQTSIYGPLVSVPVRPVYNDVSSNIGNNRKEPLPENRLVHDESSHKSHSFMPTAGNSQSSTFASLPLPANQAATLPTHQSLFDQSAFQTVQNSAVATGIPSNVVTCSSSSLPPPKQPSSDVRTAPLTIVNANVRPTMPGSVSSHYAPTMSFMPIAQPTVHSMSTLSSAAGSSDAGSFDRMSRLQDSQTRGSVLGAPAFTATQSSQLSSTIRSHQQTGGTAAVPGNAVAEPRTAVSYYMHHSDQQPIRPGIMAQQTQQQYLVSNLQNTSHNQDTSLSSEGRDTSREEVDFAQVDNETLNDYSQLSSRVEQHQSRQEELKRFIQMLLNRPPGSPVIVDQQQHDGSVSGQVQSQFPDDSAQITGRRSATNSNTLNEMSQRPSKGPRRDDGILTREQLGEISELLHSFRSHQDSGRLSPGDSLEGAFQNRSFDDDFTGQQSKLKNKSFSGQSGNKVRRNKEGTYKVRDQSKVEVRVASDLGSDVLVSKPPVSVKHKGSRHGKATTKAWK